jgi:TRAP-type C4-dicarboxylate transport system permease small subunit
MLTLYDFFESILKGLSWFAITAAALITLAIAVIGTLDIITTNVLSNPVPGAFELSESGLIILVFFGLAVTSRSGSHITVDILTNRLPVRGQKICDAIGYLFTSVLFAFWTQQMYFLALKSFKIHETATGLLQFPIYIVKIAAFLGIMIATVETLRRLFISIAESIKKNPSRERSQ